MSEGEGMRIHYFPKLRTLDIWLGDSSLEVESEAVTDNLILKLDGEGRVIGVEVLDVGGVSEEDVARLPRSVRESLSEALREILKLVEA